jgi:hypothetical protein
LCSNISEITGSSTIANEITRSGIGGGEADTDSNAEGSLNEQEDDVDATPCIEQISMRSSSDPSAGGRGAVALRDGAGVEDEALATFTCFIICADGDATLAGLFRPELILSTPAFATP